MKKDQCLLQSLYFTAAAFQRTSDQSIGLPKHLGMLKIFFPPDRTKRAAELFRSPFLCFLQGV